MNKKFLILLLALSLSSCAKDNNEEKVEVLSSGIKIESVSQKDHIKQKETEVNSSSNSKKLHEERESKSSYSKNKNEKEDISKKETYTDDYKAHRRAIVEYGKFSWDFANSLSDQQIRAYYDKAKELSENTGYWDIKDFVFQEIAKDYPNKSEKFPLDSIDEVYKWKKSQNNEITDKFNDEREEFINKGFRKKDVYELKDKEIEDAFKEAYKKDSSLYYDGYIKLASE
ncbi:MAG: hypothetical protein Q4B52_01685, partial [Tissierellia bacterium]|nr:hypothetical protein [Tissierellia bacterium]